MDDSQKGWQPVRLEDAKPDEEAAGKGSATGVFGVVAAPPAGGEGAVSQDVAAWTPPPPAPVKPVAADLVQPVVHRVVVGGDASGKASDYDELLNRLRAGNVQKAAPAEPKSPEPVNVAPLPPVTPSNVGFSQLLQTLNVAPVAAEPPPGEQPAEMRPIAVQTIDLRGPVQDDADVAALLRTQAAEKPPEVVQEPMTPSAAAPASAPVSFTQMLRGLDVKSVEAPVASVASPPVAAVPQAPAESSPGSFTQMFRALDAKPESAPVKTGFVPAAAPAPAPSPAESTPGTFTQLFRTLDAKPESEPVRTDFAPAASAPAAPPASSPGTFTQLFRTLDSGANAPAPPAPAARMDTPPVAPPRRDEGGSFTQMLSAQRPQDAPSFRESSVPPQRPVSDPGAWDAAPVGGGFGELPAREPERRPEPAGGGLTQLLRTLDGPSSAPPVRREETPFLPPPAGGGAFTQAYQRLDGPEQAPPAAAPPVQATPFAPAVSGFNPVAPPMAPPPASAGPSEFTRILDASRMREMGLRGGSDVPGVPQAAPVAAPMMPQMQPPMQPPQMPPMQMPPMQPPQMQQPMMPPHGMPQGGGYPMPPMAAPQMAAPAMPAAPVVQPPQVAAPPSGMQKNLPMILIAIIFVLLVVVIALVFVMKR